MDRSARSLAGADDVVSESMGDELCLMRLSTSAVLVLNRTASDVWLLASEGMPAADVVTSVAVAYGADAADIAPQVHTTLADLLEHGFLVEAAG